MNTLLARAATIGTPPSPATGPPRWSATNLLAAGNVEERSGVNRQIACEGCGEPTPLDAIMHAADEGNICHYCHTCMGEYLALKAACEAEAARHQRIIDIFVADARDKCGLRVIPQDFPTRDAMVRLG